MNRDPSTGAGIRARDWFIQKNFVGLDHTMIDFDALVAAVFDRDERPLSPTERPIVEALAGALRGEFGSFMRVSNEEWRKTAKALLARMGTVTLTFSMPDEGGEIPGVFLALHVDDRVGYTVERGGGGDVGQPHGEPTSTG